MRTFSAVPLPLDLRARLWKRTGRLRATPTRVSWVATEQMHLTLAFHGEQPEACVQTLAEALDRHCAGQGAFDLEVRGVGWFGGPDKPRVLWAGIGTGSDAARTLQQQAAQAMVDAGLPPETRSWHPHITLGRVRDHSRRRPAELLAEVQRLQEEPLGQCSADRVLLMRSVLTDRGPRHSELRQIPLAPAQAAG